jgi:hypothetical protein
MAMDSTRCGSAIVILTSTIFFVLESAMGISSVKQMLLERQREKIFEFFWFEIMLSMIHHVDKFRQSQSRGNTTLTPATVAFKTWNV